MKQVTFNPPVEGLIMMYGKVTVKVWAITEDFALITFPHGHISSQEGPSWMHKSMVTLVEKVNV